LSFVIVRYDRPADSHRDFIMPDRSKPLTKDWLKLGKPFPIPLLSAKAENAVNRIGNHVLFVRTNAANIITKSCFFY